MAISEYAKVSFITTKSGRIPNMLKHTGALVVMNDVSTGSNNRHSLWLRGNLIGSGWGFSKEEYMKNGEWFVQSYNPIFSPSSGASYFIPSKNIEDTPEIKYAEDGKTVIGMPQSIQMWLSYGILYTNSSILNLSNSIDIKLNGLQQQITNVSNRVTNLDKKVNDNFTILDNKITTTRNDCYTYTKYWVNRILGDAPEYLDSIKELNSWLQANRDNALQTLGKIQELDKNKPSLDATSNGFTYISERQWYSEIDEKTNLKGWYTYTYYDDNETMANPQVGTTYYTYHPSKVSYGGTISLKSSQISTDSKWHNIPLDKILERLVDKYPYKIPEVLSFSIESKSIDDWCDDVIEYGANLSLSNFNVNVKLNDSSFIKMKMNPTESIITSSMTNNLQNGVNGISNVNIVTGHSSFSFNNKNSIIDGIEKKVKIFNGYTINYGDAILQEYPQLKGIDGSNKIIDESGYKGSSSTVEYPIYKKHNFKVYWGCSDASPVNAGDLKNANSKFLEKTSTGKLVTETNHPNLWICLPEPLISGSKVIMKSWTSGIENDVTSISTDMLKNSKLNTFNYNGMNYATIQIENLEFTMFADKVSMEVIFN